LAWSAPGGTYELSASGDGSTPVETTLRQTFTHGAKDGVLKPQATAQNQSGTATAGFNPNVAGTFVHEPALPGTRYVYTLKAVLADGRKVCGHAVANTPAPPVATALSGTYIDPNNIVLSMTAPPYVHSIKISRGAIVVSELLGEGSRVGANGLKIPEIRINRPGPPPLPDWSGPTGAPRYQPGQLTYDFMVETTWKIAERGPTRTSQTIVKVQGPTRPTWADISIVTANTAGTGYPKRGDGSHWPVRYDRLALEISNSGPPPDVISLTEIYGWSWCSSPLSERANDYEAIDVIVDGLARRTGTIYRVAYMVGKTGRHGGVNGSRCQEFFGDAVLYNPKRLINRTPQDVTGKPQVAHDGPASGLQVRRSLPICNPGTLSQPIASLIDGPVQTDKCDWPTPSGPAWALALKTTTFDQVIASLARFAFVHDPRATFDVFTIHAPNSLFSPPNPELPEVTRQMVDFIERLSKPPFRREPSMLPALVVGDFNGFADTPTWLPMATEVFVVKIDLMRVMQATPVGSAPPRFTPTFARSVVLPRGTVSRETEDPKLLFSDHIALRVDFVD
jgi:hypothetical protein